MTGIELRSPAFSDHAPMPSRYSRDGDNIAPPLEWSGVPEDAAEVALLVEDPDAPGGVFVHWVLAGLPPADGELAQSLPAGAVEGRNDFGQDGWDGPQPPAGDPPHRYFFHVFAAAEPLDLADGATADELRNALRGKELASGTLVGTYQR